MDPTTTYRELVLAIRRGDRADAQDYADSLKAWLDKVGE